MKSSAITFILLTCFILTASSIKLKSSKKSLHTSHSKTDAAFSSYILRHVKVVSTCFETFFDLLPHPSCTKIYTNSSIQPMLVQQQNPVFEGNRYEYCYPGYGMANGICYAACPANSKSATGNVCLMKSGPSLYRDSYTPRLTSQIWRRCPGGYYPSGNDTCILDCSRQGLVNCDQDTCATSEEYCYKNSSLEATPFTSNLTQALNFTGILSSAAIANNSRNASDMLSQLYYQLDKDTVKNNALEVLKVIDRWTVERFLENVANTAAQRLFLDSNQVTTVQSTCNPILYEFISKWRETIDNSDLEFHMFEFNSTLPNAKANCVDKSASTGSIYNTICANVVGNSFKNADPTALIGMAVAYRNSTCLL